MAKQKHDLTKKTLNLRTGDLEKMGELFPDMNGGSVAIRELVSRFVDKHYKAKEARTPPVSDIEI